MKPKSIPEPSIDDMVFLMKQLMTMEHLQDRQRIASIAKKYDIHTPANHKGKRGVPPS